jgi:hypothetical protein
MAKGEKDLVVFEGYSKCSVTSKIQKLIRNVYSHFGYLDLKISIFFFRNLVFINDFNVLQKVSEKLGQNLPMVSLFKPSLPLTS